MNVGFGSLYSVPDMAPDCYLQDDEFTQNFETNIGDSLHETECTGLNISCENAMKRRY